MKKGIIAVLVVLALFAISWAEELFFFKWEIKTTGLTEKGLLQVTLKNPESRGIPSVVTLMNPVTDIIIAYWYFDEQGFPKLFILEGGKYVSKPELTKNCSNCHKTT